MAQDDFQLLVGAVQRAESGNRRYGADGRLLTSPKGAQGEMQVMPATQRSPGFGVEPAKRGDPEDIARAGRDYLKAMLDKYGNREHALAAYNWGPGNVDKWLAKGADPTKLPKETQDYISRVQRFMGKPSDVPRETTPGPTEAEKIMEPALRSGMTARAPTTPAPATAAPTVPRETPAQLASLGPNYQAALALSVLADADEEERKDRDIDDDREPSIAQKWLMEQSSRPAALASLSDISIKSPFAEPTKMKDGGEVSGKAKRALEAMRQAGETAMSLPGAGMNLGYRAYKKITGTDPIEDLLQKIERQNPPLDVTEGSEPIKRAEGGDVNDYNRRLVVGLADPEKWKVPEPLLPGNVLSSVAAPLFAESDPSGYGPGSAVGGQSGAPVGQGISNAAVSAGLAAMGVPSPAAAMGITNPTAASVVNAMSPMGMVAAMGLNAAGSAVAGQQADAMGQAQAALDAMSAVPGITTVSDANGNVVGISNDASIAAADAAVAAASSQAEADAAAAAVDADSASTNADSSSTSGDGDGDGPGFAQGGEVQEPNVFKVPLYAETVAYEMYPGQGGQFDQRDAARHMLAAGTLARKYGPTAAEILGKLHEVSTSPLRYIGSKLGISEMPVDYEQDLHNNRIGIELAQRSRSQKELEEFIQRAAEGAKGQKMEGQPWIGRPQKPVKRANGSPIGGEEADLSRPITYNPKIRRQGEAARRLAALRDVNTLPDPRTYAAVSGFFGVAPDEMGFSVLHPDLPGIQKAGEKGFAAGTVAQVAPMAAAVRGLGSAGTTTAAKMLAGMKDIPVGMAVKPRGGVFMPSEGEGITSKLASTVDDYVEMARRQNLPEEVQSFIRTKAPKYFTTTYGTANDPLRIAIQERKLEPFARDVEKMPPYMVDAAKNPEVRGHKQAKTDLERMYDQLTGLSAQYYSEARGTARTNLMRQAEIDRMTQEGVPREFMNPVHPDGFTMDDIHAYPYMSKGLTQLMDMQRRGELPQHLQQALRTGELIYDVQPMFSMLQPREVAQALAQVAPNKLKNMSFPDALVEGLAKLLPIRDYEAAIDIAERGGRVPKKALFQFTQPVLKAEGQQWVQITDPIATRMEGKLMNHSVGGYAEGDNYGTAYTGLKVGGKKAFDEGLVRVYSLRDAEGMPSITVEAAKLGDGWRVSQVRGRFNSAPEDKEAVFKLFDKLDQSDGLKDIKLNSYNRSATGEAIKGNVVDWGREYDLWKTGAE